MNMPESPSLIAYREAAASKSSSSQEDQSASVTAHIIKRTPFLTLIRGFWHILLLQVWMTACVMPL